MLCVITIDAGTSSLEFCVWSMPSMHFWTRWLGKTIRNIFLSEWDYEYFQLLQNFFPFKQFIFLLTHEYIFTVRIFYLDIENWFYMTAFHGSTYSDREIWAGENLAKWISVPAPHSLSSNRIRHPHPVPGNFTVPPTLGRLPSPLPYLGLASDLLWPDISRYNANRGMENLCNCVSFPLS